MDDNGSLSMEEFIEIHGVTDAGIDMMVQLAEALEASPRGIVFSDAAKADVLAWLAAWREAAK